jgi:hypothetical protein
VIGSLTVTEAGGGIGDAAQDLQWRDDDAMRWAHFAEGTLQKSLGGGFWAREKVEVKERAAAATATASGWGQSFPPVVLIGQFSLVNGTHLNLKRYSIRIALLFLEFTS